ncbi:MAG: nucleotidyltransferase family protein [Deltaproteobacteria bacterium]|nr:nucleotidyltransferase family protein [Deltaproteobacteria bacterium]
MKSDGKIAALILAGGLSSRMGAFKPLLTLGGRLIIEGVISLFREAGISDIIVVVGYQAEKIIPLLEDQGIRWVVNEHYDRGMFSSVQVGVRKLAGDCQAFFLSPADIPLVNPVTLKKLVAACREGKMDVYHPCYGQRRGHPPLIAAAMIPSILAFAEPGGLRVLLSRCKGRSVDVACDDPGILIDLDTPEDYERAKG